VLNICRKRIKLIIYKINLPDLKLTIPRNSYQIIFLLKSMVVSILQLINNSMGKHN